MPTTKKKKADLILILAIVFAAIAIAGSVIFLGLQLNKGGGSDNLGDAIQKGIQDYIQEQESASRPIAEVNEEKIPTPERKEYIRGNKDAKITLIEYSDFACPYCEAFHATAKQLVEQSDGEINWIYRHYPLPSHEPIATLAGMASECVGDLNGDESFWNYVDILFANRRGLNQQSLITLGEQIGVDGEKLQECIDSGKHEQTVKDDFEAGNLAGVTGTPGTIVYNNETGRAVRVSGNQSIDTFNQVIETVKQ